MAQDHPAMDAVKRFILGEFLPGEDPINLKPTTPLMSTGILDSIAMLKLITFLERELGIQIQAHEADEEHFNTLDAICELVETKR